MFFVYIEQIKTPPLPKKYRIISICINYLGIYAFIDVARTLKEGNKGVVGCLLLPSARPSTCENR
jgi:hypothetical protein